MINSKSTFFFGIIIFLLPFLGFPTFWKTLIAIFAGLFLVFSSIDFVIPKKNNKARPKKQKEEDTVYETIQTYSKEPVLSPIDIHTLKSEKKRNLHKVKLTE